jgi:hypothetical protein
MNTITQETPYYYVIEKAAKPSKQERAVVEGSKLHSTYFEIRITFPVLFEIASQEMTDAELVFAAERTGTFDFLNSSEEDGYNDLIKKRE